MTDLKEQVLARLKAEGWDAAISGTTLAATKEVILSKWFLGSRRVKLRIACQFDESAKTLRYRETATEVATGMPPPTISFNTTRQNGLEVTEKRKDVGVGGGGLMHYGEARQWAQNACAEAGWIFQLKL
ncbi:hypothetical protein [Rhodoferax sp.]|uniref:hypothetical protein n=1 Tax=Rhodoferax sp. TaxID=50421 RepID=UPI00260CEC5D|nr:hypothetical protein [Rhodoferax sp.]MDD2925852.1 hypothetical protein [Rhodoferax sp.]